MPRLITSIPSASIAEIFRSSSAKRYGGTWSRRFENLTAANSSESSTEQISCAGPVEARAAGLRARRGGRRRRGERSTGLSHQPFATRPLPPRPSSFPRRASPPLRAPTRPTLMSCGPSTRMSWTFVRSGKRSWFSTSGPSRSRSPRSGSPADDRVRIADRDRRELDLLAAHVDRLPLPHLDLADVHLDLVAARACARGPRAGRRGSPPRPRRSCARASARRCACRCPDSSAVEPSGFQITTSASAPFAEMTSRMPSEPTPKW